MGAIASGQSRPPMPADDAPVAARATKSDERPQVVMSTTTHAVKDRHDWSTTARPATAEGSAGTCLPGARPGIGPVTAAVILRVYSHHGRIRSEAAFAALAGVSPLPASSGNTVRHRLNRHGDRQLNMALDIIEKIRMVHDETIRLYAARRTGEGRTYREIKRVLKRYTARAIFRELQTLFA